MRVLCVICTDVIEENFSATPCGHTFHFECLSQWLLHKKSCPQCREICKPKDVIKLFVTTTELTRNNDLLSMDPKDMQEKIVLQEKLLTHKDHSLEKALGDCDNKRSESKAWQLQYNETHRKLKEEQSSCSILKKQLTSLQFQLDEVKGLRKEAEKLRTRVSTLGVVEKMLKGSKEEINTLIVSHNSHEMLATVIVALKKDYDVLKGKRLSLIKEKDKQHQEISRIKKQLQSKEEELKISKELVSALESDLHAAEEEKRTTQKKVEMLQEAFDSPHSYRTLKRMLESPIPDFSTQKPLDVGASPLLAAGHPVDIQDVNIVRRNVLGEKRLVSNEENIVMPVPKLRKKAVLLKPKTFSKGIKKDLKFAPRNKFMFFKK